MRVFFVPSDFAGGGRVRSHWPADVLRSRGWEVYTARPGFWPQVVEGDVVIVHRPRDEEISDQVLAAQANGAKVFVDIDDDFRCVPDTNKWPAEPGQAERIEEAIETADGLITPTHILAGRYGFLARTCRVIPNRLPSWVGQVRPHFASNVVRVGWAGHVGVHRHDLEWIRPAVQKMLAGAMLVTVGDLNTTQVLQWFGPGERAAWVDDPVDYYRLVAHCDIGIVPLDNEEHRAFNEAKSWLKALEFMTLGRPVVATDLPEQRRLIEHGVTGFVADDPADFAGYVQLLVRDPDLRIRMAAAAQLKARELSIETSSEWDQLVREATRADREVRSRGTALV